MRLPNGFGSVYKLSGNRRCPWAARKTIGWNDKGHPIYKYIGYYKTRAEALSAITDFNNDPYDYSNLNVTLEDLYNKWSDEKFEEISLSNIRSYKASWNLCDNISSMPLKDIKLDHFQNIVNKSDKNYPTLKKFKTLLNQMYDYGVKHEIIPYEKHKMISYINIKKAGNPNAYNRMPFSKKEIKLIWDNCKSNEYISIILMLIYSGVRIGELLDLKKENVFIEEKYFFIKSSKTKSGIREVPISDKTLDFFKYWMSKDCEYLVCTPDHKHFLYRNYYDSYWMPFMKQFNLEHKPHDTRHTCITLLTEAGIDERIIRQIVGHKGQGVTQIVYTHIDLENKLIAINKI